MMVQATQGDGVTCETRVLCGEQAERFAWGSKPVIARWAKVANPRLAARGTKRYLLRTREDEGGGWTIELGRL
jgi:hypothetical protein